MTKIPHMEIEAETTTRRVSLVATEVSGIGESAPDCDVRHQRWLIVLDIFNRFVMVVLRDLVLSKHSPDANGA